ncbi:MAG: hypothetical protein WBG11_15575 [Methylocella sp.]
MSEEINQAVVAASDELRDTLLGAFDAALAALKGENVPDAVTFECFQNVALVFASAFAMNAGIDAEGLATAARLRFAEQKKRMAERLH